MWKVVKENNKYIVARIMWVYDLKTSRSTLRYIEAILEHKHVENNITLFSFLSFLLTKNIYG